MKTPRWKKVLIPFTILLFPAVLWLVIVTGHNHFATLPVLGPVEISSGGDTVYHSLPSFSFLNQDGKIIGDRDISNQIFVANFFFASCKSVCPQMNEQVGRIQYAFKDVPGFHILSFTVDPEHDSVPVLKAYAEKMKADSSVWWFLTGSKDSIYALARDGFLIPAAAGKTKNDFFHSQDVILIDKQKRIRAIADGTDQSDVDTLIDKVKLLMEEYRLKK